MNGYMAFYKGKSFPVYAASSYDAQEKAALMCKARKRWEVSVYICEKDGEQYVHTATT